MKQLIIFILTIVLILSCKNNIEVSEPNSTKIPIVNMCGTIEYKEKIGNDFDSALDSLIKKYEPAWNILVTEGHYSGKGYNIDEKIIDVDYNYDNRKFIFITFTDKANDYNILNANDIIDDKGNHYWYVACED